MNCTMTAIWLWKPTKINIPPMHGIVSCDDKHQCNHRVSSNRKKNLDQASSACVGIDCSFLTQQSCFCSANARSDMNRTFHTVQDICIRTNDACHINFGFERRERFSGGQFRLNGRT